MRLRVPGSSLVQNNEISVREKRLYVVLIEVRAGLGRVLAGSAAQIENRVGRLFRRFRPEDTHMKADLTALRLTAVLWHREIAAVDGRVDRYIELAAAPLEPRPVFPSDEYASLRGVAAGARNSSCCCQHGSRGKDKGSHWHCRSSRPSRAALSYRRVVYLRRFQRECEPSLAGTIAGLYS